MLTFKEHLLERNQSTQMKDAGGNKQDVYYTNGSFWFFGQNLGNNITTAREKLVKITNNSNWISDMMSDQEKNDKKAIQKSIERNLKKMANANKDDQVSILDLLGLSEAKADGTITLVDAKKIAAEVEKLLGDFRTTMHIDKEPAGFEVMFNISIENPNMFKDKAHYDDHMHLITTSTVKAHGEVAKGIIKKYGSTSFADYKKYIDE